MKKNEYCCNVCENAMTETNYPVSLNCGHTICFQCFQTIITSNNATCPYCKLTILKTAPKNYYLSELLSEDKNKQCQEISNVIEKKDKCSNEIESKLKCLKGHKLIWIDTVRKCMQCDKKNFSFGCEECKFYYCLDCLHKEKLIFTKNYLDTV